MKIPRLTVLPQRVVVGLALTAVVAAAIAAGALVWALRPEAPMQLGDPVVVRNSLDMAVVRIPAQRGELVSQCTLVIDYRYRTWALSC